MRASCEDALGLSVQQERLIDGLLTLATSERGIERWEEFDLGAHAQTVVDAHREAQERQRLRPSDGHALDSRSSKPARPHRTRR
jgi:hypothetical protein